jgi:hypothetical protein
MKRKIQHDAVNKQEDEDSCAYPICSTNNPPVDIKEDNFVGDSSDHLLSESPTNNDELQSYRE